jgi:hypothetical protein
MPLRSTRLELGVGIAAFLSVAVTATGQSFTLDRETNNKVTLARPANGLIPLRLIYKAQKPETPVPAKVHLSAPILVGDASNATAVNSAAVLIGPGKCDSKPTQPNLDLEPKSNAEDLCLFVGDLAPGKYTGNLIITADGVDTVLKQFEITQPPVPVPATLTATAISVSQPAPIELMLPFWGSEPGLTNLTATLQEKGKADVEGLVVHLDVVKSPSAYDPSKVIAKLNSVATDLFVSDASRKILAGQQAKVDLALKDLEPGEYNIVFRFSGANAPADDAQKLTAVIHVRSHWLWAALLILVATMVSFLSSKVVAAKRRRSDLQEKIGDLQPAWLGEFAETQPVVWVRAMLRQAETLSSRYWLTSPDRIEARVNQVSNVLKILEEARRLRDRLHDALDPLVFRRVIQSLERLVRQVGAGTIDDQTVSKFEAEMTTFEDWLSKDRYPSTLWGAIQPEMLRLQAAIAANQAAVPGLPSFGVHSAFLNVALATPPTTAGAVDDTYRTYMILSILWGRRGEPDLLQTCGQAGDDLMKLFDIVDERDWQDLKHANPANLAIQLPTNTDEEGLQAFAPLEFSVTTGATAVERSYLFHHNISCAWSFQFSPKRRLLGKPPTPVTLTPRTLGPSVMQYFPQAGQVKVSTVLSFRGDSVTVESKEPLEITRSREFSILKGFEQAELLAWSIATAIAIGSGLLIYYFNATGWGSFKDYLTLFIWGAGADQGKNFLQSTVAK